MAEYLFYWMYLDPINVADIMQDLTDGMREPPHGQLVGIVSEEDGGIIAYALGEDHANQIVNALRRK